MNRTAIHFDDVSYAFMYVSAGAPGENEAHLCLHKGTFHFHTVIGDNEEPLPKDVADASKYLPVPHRYDLDLGQQLVRDFTDEFLPDEQDQVRDIFRHRGAYRRFKDFLYRRDMLDAWHRYQQRREDEAARQWCADNGVELLD